MLMPPPASDRDIRGSPAAIYRPVIVGYQAPSLFERKYFLNADLVNQTPSAQVFQMRPFFVIRQVFANAVDHHHNERTVIHIEPVRMADQLIFSVSNERAINLLTQVWLVKSCDNVCPDGGTPERRSR
jgi:hypothetical protein